jgi:hypothetical protein
MQVAFLKGRADFGSQQNLSVEENLREHRGAMVGTYNRKAITLSIPTAQTSQDARLAQKGANPHEVRCRVRHSGPLLVLSTGAADGIH